MTIAGERDVPIRRARLTLESDALPQPQLGDSDTDGRFRFAGLPAGSYRLRAEKPGFVTTAFGARHARDRGLPIDLASGQTRPANLALPRGAALDGRIVNAEGDPVQNLVVSAARLTYGPYGRETVLVKDARTDDLGRYRIHSLPPGDYYVQAAPDPRDLLSERQATGPRPPGIARTFYPGTPSVSDAERLSLTAGRDATGLDFTLTAVPIARVTLRVVDSTGKPPKALSTRIQRVGSPPGEVRGALIPPNQAMYPSVTPGDFWIMAAATPAAPGAEAEYVASLMSISGSDLNLTLATAPGFALAGKVVSIGGTVARLTGLRVRAEGVEYELPNPAGSGAPAAPAPAVAADGAVVVGGLVGPHLFRLDGLPGGWSLVSVRLGDADVTDLPIDLKTADGPRELVLTVTDHTGTITGAAVDAQKRTVPNARIVVFPEGEGGWSARSRFVKTTLAGPDGAYSIGSLLPGRYLACAVEWLDDGAWFDPDLLRGLRAGASPIQVEPGDRRTVMLTLGGRR